MNEPLKAYLYVGLGSALGGVARFWLAGLIGWRFHPTIGVLFVNVTGSFLIGLIAGLTSARSAPVTKWFLMTGVMGGYTTFSSFSLQTLELMQKGEWIGATANAGASLLFCLVGVWLGFLLGHLVQR